MSAPMDGAASPMSHIASPNAPGGSEGTTSPTRAQPSVPTGHGDSSSHPGDSLAARDTDGGTTVTSEASSPSPSAGTTPGDLHAAWTRTALTPDGGPSRPVSPSRPETPEAPTADHEPSLSIDPALSALPKPERDDTPSAGSDTNTDESSDLPPPPPAEQLVVIPDKKNPDEELVLGPDGEPLEDTSYVLDDPALGLDDDAPGPSTASGADAGTEPVAIPYQPDAGSLRVLRSIAVRSEPRQDAPPLGTVAQDMRILWKSETAMRGPECDAWVEIQPRGWVCERYLERNFREPRVRDLPRLREGELTPGTYARVVGKRVRAYPSLALARTRRKGILLKGSVTVKLRGQVRVGRRTFWRTTDGQYLEARVLREYRPSTFVGVDAEQLSELSAPFAWAQSRTKPSASVEVKTAPDAKAARETVLPPRTLVAVKELSADGRWVLIAENHWVSRDDLHVAWFSHAPPGVEPGARWVDVDLDAQVLVAYEGERPVYATLISSGKPGTDTPEGLFRVWIKFAEADMTGNGTAGNDTYRVATVPWTMFFEQDYALHTAYWHDRFGEPTSHGCVNLAPRDAKALYGWASPEVPTGWSMVHATQDAPGSWVRIRGQARIPVKERKVRVATSTRTLR
ncbi:ErfK/YbiS/YcfS/YnhG family protein [Myxococcus stipitatus DSM 14675]|uniref:ErfK/YbiS/YcfS/YnhG family protein n=2 Tax=Myxococcus stipitatus TaxID=83455 RepID=L7U3Y8_MYXSD|nr:ErfK/YbiS/YcfS/YnhG family protein [Myxococcus stipitatus DSM 14675]